MTVNVSDITSGPHLGNDIADEFSYDFKVVDKTQLVVYETDDLGVVTTLTVDTDYTVNNIGNESGGTITRTAGPLPTGYDWFIVADYKLTQLTDFESQGGFFPDIHEDAIDKLTYIALQQQRQIDLSFRFPDSYSGGASTELPEPVANRGVKWNATGDALENTDNDPDEVPNNAQASADAAATSASNAATSESNAATSAAEAAASAASIAGWGDHSQAGYVTAITDFSQFATPTGTYGAVQISDDNGNGWYGISLNGYAALMGKSDKAGVYDDVNNAWLFGGNYGGSFDAYYAGSVKLQTTTVGVTIAGTWTATSDERLKKNLRRDIDVKEMRDKLMQVQWLLFDWRDGSDTEVLGVIAQIRKVLPEVVYENDKGYLTVDYSRIHSMWCIVNAWQEERLEDQAERIQKLEEIVYGNT